MEILVEHLSGQIIATSAEVTLNGGLVRVPSPQNPLNSGLGIIVICPDLKNEPFIFNPKLITNQLHV